MEKEILAIVEKVKTMFKYDTLLRDIIKVNPSAKLLIKDDELKLEYICFNNYDSLVVYSNKIVFKAEMGSYREILTYKSFDELLEM